MNTKATVIISATLFALLAAPASARIDGDEGGASAYPRFTNERTPMANGNRNLFSAPSHPHLVNRPPIRRK